MDGWMDRSYMQLQVGFQVYLPITLKIRHKREETIRIVCTHEESAKQHNQLHSIFQTLKCLSAATLFLFPSDTPITQFIVNQIQNKMLILNADSENTLQMSMSYWTVQRLHWRQCHPSPSSQWPSAIIKTIQPWKGWLVWLPMVWKPSSLPCTLAALWQGNY